jgi:hypothetical protein
LPALPPPEKKPVDGSTGTTEKTDDAAHSGRYREARMHDHGSPESAEKSKVSAGSAGIFPAGALTAKCRTEPILIRPLRAEPVRQS